MGDYKYTTINNTGQIGNGLSKMTIREVGCDPRKRSFLLPIRVVYTQGKVSGEENLLNCDSLQIHISETATAFLDNRDSDVPAGVLLDFGREITGGVRILCASVEESAYPKVRIRFGESASEALSPLGRKNAGNDHAVRDFTIPVPAMSDQEWGQTGFRFVYVELVEPNAAICFKNIFAVFVRRDLDYRGSFRCNDPLLERIFDTAAYTCHLCMQSLLWDGVKRDRLVWIGDMHPEMLAIRSLFGRDAIVEDSLDDMRAATPLPGWMNGFPSYSLWYLLILRDWYFYIGDNAYIESHKEYVQMLTDQLLDCINEDGRVCFSFYFLDWPSFKTPAAEEGVQALAVLAMDALLELLTVYLDERRAELVRQSLDKMRHYPVAETEAKPVTALLYLAEMLQAEMTKEKLLRNGDKGISTFMSYYILTALSRVAGAGSALPLLRRYYGGMLEMGATTFWEDFSTEWMENACPIDRLPGESEKDIHGDFGVFCYEGFRHSLCHGWASGAVPFLMETVLGIRFTSPGGKTISLCPDLGDLDWAEGTYPLPDGQELWVRCTRTLTGIDIAYRSPSGVCVTIDKPHIERVYEYDGM